jgi:hypothetical protein
MEKVFCLFRSLPILILVVCVLIASAPIVESISSEAEKVGWAKALQPWQAFIGISVALAAACIAWVNASRSINHAAFLERKRRSKKYAGLRATLPLALSAVSDYATQCDAALEVLHNECDEGLLPAKGYVIPSLPSLPSEAVAHFSELIEYSDDVNVNLIEKIISRIQVHQSRLRDILKLQDCDGSSITKRWLAENIVHGAVIYASAESAYEYARKEIDTLAKDVTWDQVRVAIRHLRLTDDEESLADVYDLINLREKSSNGPR